VFNKDAMDKVEAVVETKVEEVTVKVDEVLEKIENTEITIEQPKIVETVLDKLDDIPVIKDAIENIVEVVDGRVFTCSCWSWVLTLRITRKTNQTSPPKPEENPNKSEEKPSQCTPQEKSPQTTVPE